LDQAGETLEELLLPGEEPSQARLPLGRLGHRGPERPTPSCGTLGRLQVMPLIAFWGYGPSPELCVRDDAIRLVAGLPDDGICLDRRIRLQAGRPPILEVL